MRQIRLILIFFVLIFIQFSIYEVIAMGEPVLRSREQIIEILKNQQGLADPIISGGETKQISGLGFYSVNDKSKETEYVVTRNGKSYDAREIDKAIKEIGYYPLSEKDALEAAARIVEIKYKGARIIYVPVDVQMTGEEEKTLKNTRRKVSVADLAAPVVFNKGKYFEVVLFSFTEEKAHDSFFIKHVIKLGKGICETQQIDYL